MRVHLFEWMDQAWCPVWMRDAMRGYLSVVYDNLSICEQWAALLGPVLATQGETRVLDLGSGTAGPLARVTQALRSIGMPVESVATDLYPPTAAPVGVPFLQQPVDARRVPDGLAGVRTMFAAFHHLRPDDARAVLRTAFSQRRAICVFEATSRTPLAIASAMLIPFMVLWCVPKIRPLRPGVLWFTYVCPVLPLLLWWDGLVSHLRTYSRNDLRRLIRDLEADDYQWTIGELHSPGVPFPVPYLIGQHHLSIGLTSAECVAFDASSTCSSSSSSPTRRH